MTDQNIPLLSQDQLTLLNAVVSAYWYQFTTRNQARPAILAESHYLVFEDTPLPPTLKQPLESIFVLTEAESQQLLTTVKANESDSALHHGMNSWMLSKAFLPETMLSLTPDDQEHLIGIAMSPDYSRNDDHVNEVLDECARVNGEMTSYDRELCYAALLYLRHLLAVVLNQVYASKALSVLDFMIDDKARLARYVQAMVPWTEMREDDDNGRFYYIAGLNEPSDRFSVESVVSQLAAISKPSDPVLTEDSMEVWLLLVFKRLMNEVWVDLPTPRFTSSVKAAPSLAYRSKEIFKDPDWTTAYLDLLARHGQID